jgi:hypothetical protein
MSPHCRSHHQREMIKKTSSARMWICPARYQRVAVAKAAARPLGGPIRYKQSNFQKFCQNHWTVLYTCVNVGTLKGLSHQIKFPSMFEQAF